MGTGRATTGKKRGGGGGSVSEAAALAKSKAGPEGVLTALSSIKPEELQHVMEEIETEMYSRAKRLRLEAEEHALSLQNAFHVELMKLPKSVRAMSLREFSEQYGEDIRSVMRLAVEEEASRALSQSHHKQQQRQQQQRRKKGLTGTVVKAAPPTAGRTSRSGAGGRAAGAAGAGAVSRSSEGGGGAGGGRMSTRSSSISSSSNTARNSSNSIRTSVNSGGGLVMTVMQTPMGVGGGRATRSGRGRVRGMGGVHQTPMMKFDPRLPTTPGIRAPRYGESVLSVNGSPLQVPLPVDAEAMEDEDTAAFTRAALGGGREGEGGGSGSPSLMIELPNGGGETVDIFKDPSALAHMDSQMKADVASKIERLQSGLAYVLQHIGGALLGGGGGGEGGGKSN
ncbi:hypothetical protein VYU27_008898 [Nannochloropsis oceanica]